MVVDMVAKTSNQHSRQECQTTVSQSRCGFDTGKESAVFRRTGIFDTGPSDRRRLFYRIAVVELARRDCFDSALVFLPHELFHFP